MANGTIITNKGLDLVAKLLASGTNLVFTRVAVGTGKVPAGLNVKDMFELNFYKMDGVISQCSAADTIATIVFQINSMDVRDEFVITESGLYANDPDDGEILYAYLDMTGDPQRVYKRGNAIAKIVEISMGVIVGDASNVSAQIDPNSLVNKSEFLLAIKQLDNIDCGYFTEVEESMVVAAHNSTLTSHSTMVVDGGNVIVSNHTITLDDHLADEYAHQNIILDGNID